MPQYLVKAKLKGRQVMTTMTSRSKLDARIDGAMKLAQMNKCNPSRLENLTVTQYSRAGKRNS